MSQNVIDKSGRVLGVRRFGVLEQLRLFKSLGAELSENRAYMGLARIAASVAMIDGIPMMFPTHETAVEAILERLGEDGVDAISAILVEENEQKMADEAGN